MLGEGGLVGALVGFVLTLFVFSFLIRDNPLYRFAVHLLVGVSAGYAVIVTVRDVLFPALGDFLVNPFGAAGLGWLIPVALGVLLLFKATAATARLGNAPMAALIAIGASVGLTGAVVGTLLPLISASYDNRFVGVIASVVAVVALASFYFSDRLLPATSLRLPAWQGTFRQAGRAILVATLAGLFAAILNSSLAILVERAAFYVSVFADVAGGVG